MAYRLINGRLTFFSGGWNRHARVPSPSEFAIRSDHHACTRVTVASKARPHGHKGIRATRSARRTTFVDQPLENQ